jgi:glycosyltransferase involved in cell wall biosynthesis
VRPHKNLFNLLTAFDALVRERYLPLKLFTTGNMTYAAPHVQSFLTERCLELDVINVPDLPSDIHAAFYGLAELTVVPTLFEGGFPFPFTESLSVDTPVVMSNIPAVREVLPDQLVPLALFDPYDPNSIADRIQWALEHRAELLREERTAYDELTQRTWDDVVKEYFDVFRSVADGRREQRSRPPIGRVSSIRTDVQARAG